MANAGGADEHRARPLRIVRPFGEPVIPRSRMSLSQVYELGVGAGGETTGVHAVWSEARGKRVIDPEGSYVGPVGVITPWTLRTHRLPHECLPQSVYDRFKEARGSMDLESALRVIAALGQSWDSERTELASERA